MIVIVNTPLATIVGTQKYCAEQMCVSRSLVCKKFKKSHSFEYEGARWTLVEGMVYRKNGTK